MAAIEKYAVLLILTLPLRIFPREYCEARRRRRSGAPGLVPGPCGALSKKVDNGGDDVDDGKIEKFQAGPLLLKTHTNESRKNKQNITKKMLSY